VPTNDLNDIVSVYNSKAFTALHMRSHKDIAREQGGFDCLKAISPNSFFRRHRQENFDVLPEQLGRHTFFTARSHGEGVPAFDLLVGVRHALGLRPIRSQKGPSLVFCSRVGSVLNPNAHPSRGAKKPACRFGGLFIVVTSPSGSDNNTAEVRAVYLLGLAIASLNKATKTACLFGVRPKAKRSYLGQRSVDLIKSL
jgi:hypothetical protein